MLAPLLIGVAVAAGALLLVRRSSRPATPGAVTVRPPPPGATQPARAAKTAAPSPGDQRPTVTSTTTAQPTPVTRAKAGTTTKATASQDSNHAAPTLADVASTRETPGYKAYTYPVLGTFGYSDAYAHGVLPLVPQYIPDRAAGEAAVLKQLGVPVETLKLIATQMSDQEWLDFWIIGVVPSRFAPGAKGTDSVGGWQSPYVEAALNYGVDGGMWNAVLNFWKQGATTVASLVPVVGGIVATGVKAVPVNTQANKFGGSVR